MFDQESIIKKYVDLLFQRLHENCAGGSKPLDMVAWYNWTTFDVIGDLAFGEPFGCLDNSDYHPWVKILFAGVKEGAFKFNIRRYPPIENLLMKFMPASIKNKREQHMQLTREKVRKRLATQVERPDFMDSMTRKRGSMVRDDATISDLVANVSTGAAV